jgi:hypothetical protein
MLTAADESWLSERYPRLSCTNGVLAGTIEFSATYNPATNRFLVLGHETVDVVGGRLLSGRFEIRVEERRKIAASRLPAVFIEGFKSNPDRHFNYDDSACLTSPLDEDEFLQSPFDFRRFFGELVIPFLYGQVFYSAERRWPWEERGHGAIGILEAYLSLGSGINVERCLHSLAGEKQAWSRIRPLLVQKRGIKGGTRCFCPKGDFLRRCHPKALGGIRKLKADVDERGVSLPAL